jgi:hypothetical protein
MLAHPSKNLFMFVEGNGFALPADPFRIPPLIHIWASGCSKLVLLNGHREDPAEWQASDNWVSPMAIIGRIICTGEKFYQSIGNCRLFFRTHNGPFASFMHLNEQLTP